jgi:hypothetical protein
LSERSFRDTIILYPPTLSVKTQDMEGASNLRIPFLVTPGRTRRMTLEELASKLKKLEENRRIAEVELKVLDAREECSRVYQMLELEVRPSPEGYEVSGALCNRRPRGRHR